MTTKQRIALFVLLLAFCASLGATCGIFTGMQTRQAAACGIDCPWEDIYPGPIAQSIYTARATYLYWHIVVLEDHDQNNDWLTHMPTWYAEVNHFFGDIVSEVIE